MGIQVYFKGGNTIRNLLVALRKNDNITQKSGVIYRYKCDKLEYDKEYIGDCTRTFFFLEKLKKHFRALSPIYDHANITSHHTSVDIFSIVSSESHNLTSTIKEAMYIRVNDPSLNRKIRKYQLSHIWDKILSNTPYLTLK